MATTADLHNGVSASGFSIFNDNCINNGFAPSDPNYEEFALNVEDYQIVVNRNPSVFALPGVNSGSSGSGLPKLYSIDFGMLQETIILSGTIPDGLPNSWLPTGRDMLRISRTWWHNFSLSGTSTNGFNRASIKVGPGVFDAELFGFTFQNVQISRKGGVLTYDFKMTLAVVKYQDELAPPGSGKSYPWHANAAGL